MHIVPLLYLCCSCTLNCSNSSSFCKHNLAKLGVQFNNKYTLDTTGSFLCYGCAFIVVVVYITQTVWAQCDYTYFPKYNYMISMQLREAYARNLKHWYKNVVSSCIEPWMSYVGLCWIMYELYFDVLRWCWLILYWVELWWAMTTYVMFFLHKLWCNIYHVHNISSIKYNYMDYNYMVIFFKSIIW